ncbi:MAG: group II intron maturase-specific domain-containing protein [Acidimicrobiales bacterium]
MSPLLANLALSVLDEHFRARWQAMGNQAQRHRATKRGAAAYHLVRYADDFVVMVFGSRAQAEDLYGEIDAVLAPTGLHLAPEKTRVTGIDEGFDFLGFRIQRHRQKGSDRRLIYTYPSGSSLARIRRKVSAATGRQTTSLPADKLFRHLGQLTRGWVLYFRHGASSRTFGLLGHHLWWRVWRWLKHKHPYRNARWIVRHYYGPGQWWPTAEGIKLTNPGATKIERYRFRGAKIPSPWPIPNPQTA